MDNKKTAKPCSLWAFVLLCILLDALLAERAVLGGTGKILEWLFDKFGRTYPIRFVEEGSGRRLILRLVFDHGLLFQPGVNSWHRKQAAHVYRKQPAKKISKS